MDFFKQKFIETTRTDIFDMLLSSRFKLIKKLTLSCFVSSSIPTLRWDVSRCFLLSEAFSIQFQWIFLSKNSLKPLELTFLSCCYRHVFKLIKKLILSCLIEYSDFFVGMFRDVSCYMKRSRYNFNGFFN